MQNKLNVEPVNFANYLVGLWIPTAYNLWNFCPAKTKLLMRCRSCTFISSFSHYLEKVN